MNAGIALAVAAALLAASWVVLGSGALVARAACAPPAGHSAILLAGGRVLVTVSTEADLRNQAEIYDPAANRWTPTAIQRDGGVVATLLADGRVLLTGAECDRYGPQVYDPRTDVISSAGVMAVQNGGGYTTTLLRNGKVLFAGGYGGPRDVNTQPQNFVQLYDPATNHWTLAAPTLTQRMNPQSVLLADGRVLVAGGAANAGSLPFLTSAEIYDPQTNIWSAAGEIPTNGYGSSAFSVLGNGTVLAAGGGEDGRPTSGAELFDPSTGAWSKASSMTYARSGASAMTLPDGGELVVGGQGISGPLLTSAERFDPLTGKWVVMPGSLLPGTTSSSPTPCGVGYSQACQYQTAILLKDGRVFVTAWPDFVFGHWSTADVQIFDPRVAGATQSPSPTPAATGTWSSMPDIAAPFGDYSRSGGGVSSTATATMLTDGRLLVIGTGPSTALYGPATSTSGLMAAIYDPSTGRSRLLASPSTITSIGFTTTLLRTGKVLVVGNGAELYDPVTDQWSRASAPPAQRFGHTATLLADGRVLVAGGLTGSQSNGGYGDLVSADLYQPDSNRWSAAADMPPTLGGSGAIATLLRDGRVLVVGGSAGLYDPKSNRWSDAPSLNAPAQAPQTATLLPDGRVLILGGCVDRPSFSCDRFAAPEIFDPITNTWKNAAPMRDGREAFSATLLKTGQILVAGGYGPQSVTVSTELYDPANNRWSSTEDMKLARAGQIATLLKNGSVLVVGGFFLGNLRSVELFTPPPAAHSSVAASTTSGAIGPRPALLGGAALLAVVLMVLLVIRLRTRRAGIRQLR